MQCRGHCFLYSAQTPNVTASYNWWPPHYEAWDGACVSWANALRKMTLTRSTPCTCRLYPSRAYRENLLSSLKTTGRHSVLQSTLVRHQCSRAWRCHDVNGSQSRGTCDLSPVASKRFPMFLDDTTCAKYAWISLLGALLASATTRTMRPSWRASVLAAVQNPVYECGNVRHTSLESSDTPPIHCVQHVLKFVNMFIHLPAGLQWDPVQMTEVVQQEYVLVGGSRLYPRVNIAKNYSPLKVP